MGVQKISLYPVGGGAKELVERGMELKPCPICGKRPKIKRDYGSEGSGFGAWCTIQCKPLLRMPHLKVEEGKAQWERALKCAIEEWNRRANDESV